MCNISHVRKSQMLFTVFWSKRRFISPLANKDGPHNWLWKLTAILNERNIKADCLTPFYPKFQPDWWWGFVCSTEVQTLRWGRDVNGNTFECISIGRKTLIKCVCADPQTSQDGYHILPNVRRIKIKAASSVPVGRLAALRKQAFMCSGWQAFDVSSRVWD